MEKKHPLKFFALIFLFCSVVYFPLIGHKAKNPDARLTYPPLFEVSSPAEYFRMLRSFNVVDFQPVRDLTFFMDFALFRKTGIVPFATTNILFWAITIFLLLKLLDEIAPRKSNLLWVLAFAAYPLFSQIVPWGMARKHLVAVPFLLSATLVFLHWTKSNRGAWKIILLYTLSILSHPIGLFWPAWAVAHLWLTGRKKLQDSRKLFSGLLASFTVLVLINFSYYTTLNDRVREIFADARPDPLNVPKIVLNFFFYLKEIVLPYTLSFQNYPDLTNAWPGVLIAGLALYLFRKDWKESTTLTWILFAFMPFPVFLTLPAVYDQYLLLPCAGVLILLSLKFPGDEKKLRSTLIALTFFWSALTLSQARLWVHPEQLALRNFENAPSCKSSAEVLSLNYAEGKRAPVDALSLFIKSHCLNQGPDTPPLQRIQYVLIESMMLFYEEEYFPLDVRLKRLQELGMIHYYPLLVSAAIHANLDQAEEVAAITDRVRNLTQGTKIETEKIIDGVLRPFCQEKQIPSCLEITVPYHPEPAYL